MHESKAPRCAYRIAGSFGARAIVLCATALLASCAALTERPLRRPEPIPAATPASFPAAAYRFASAHGDSIYEIDPTRSLVTIVVRRGGTLAKLGHDHVVASRDVHGFIDATTGRADVYAPLDRFTVDEPALRREAHFDTQPSEADIEGTRHNMLTRVLHVERHPFVELAVRDAAPTASSASTVPATARNVEITLNGVTRRVPVSMTVAVHGGSLEVTGGFAIDQTEFALVPMSLLGGAITVEDRLALSFMVVARRFVAPATGDPQGESG